VLLGTSAVHAERRVNLHRELLESDSDYAAEAAKIVSACLAAIRRPGGAN
jgi:hypothetical protein